MSPSTAPTASLDTADVIANQLDRRPRAVAEALNLTDEVVLIGAGERLRIPGRSDRMYPFRAHSEYLYLTERERPSGVLAFDADEGWIDFVTPVTREERLWEGAPDDAQDGRAASELENWLRERCGRPLTCLGAPVMVPTWTTNELRGKYEVDALPARPRAMMIRILELERPAQPDLKSSLWPRNLRETKARILLPSSSNRV